MLKALTPQINHAQESFRIVNHFNKTCIPIKVEAFDATKGNTLKKYTNAMEQYARCVDENWGFKVKYSLDPLETTYIRPNGAQFTIK